MPQTLPAEDSELAFAELAFVRLTQDTPQKVFATQLLS